MSKNIRFCFLAGIICLGVNIHAQSNFLAGATNNVGQNVWLQIQNQLQEEQLAIADIRAQDAAEMATNAAVLGERIQLLEQTVNDQRGNEMEDARKAEQLTLILAGAFGVAGFAALLILFYIQWRVFSQFADISARQLALKTDHSTLAGEMATAISGSARATVEASNTRLLTLVEQLEKKVMEIEHFTRAQISAPTLSTPTQIMPARSDLGNRESRPAEIHENGHGHSTAPKVAGERIADLLADGQTLLNAEQPENALKLFEEAESLDEHNTDVFIKKAGALERLNRVDDAIACYNRAIELDKAATMAWLQKGGLFNRLARHNEAMECYEKALQTHGEAKK